MKLATKLLAAPVLTALVVFGVGQVNTLVMNRAAAANRATLASQLDDYRTLASAQEQLAQVHTGVYRTVALIASLDDAKIKAFREDLVRQADGVKRVVAGISASRQDDSDLRELTGQLGREIDRYRSQADQAIDLSSVDPNTGIASMQGADKTFSGLSQTMQAMVKRGEVSSEQTVAAADAERQRISWLLGALGVLSAVLAVGLSWLMQRKLTAELQRATAIAGEVAAGNLAVDASSARND